jgi:hypothetical protein
MSRNCPTSTTETGGVAWAASRNSASRHPKPPGENSARRTLIHYGLIGVVEDVIEPIGKHYLCMIHLFLVRENCNVVAVNNEPENHADVAWFPADSPPSPVTGAFESISSALLCGGHLATVPADVRAAMWRASIQE